MVEKSPARPQRLRASVESPQAELVHPAQSRCRRQTTHVRRPPSARTRLVFARRPTLRHGRWFGPHCRLPAASLRERPVRAGRSRARRTLPPHASAAHAAWRSRRRAAAAAATCRVSRAAAAGGGRSSERHPSGGSRGRPIGFGKARRGANRSFDLRCARRCAGGGT